MKKIISLALAITILISAVVTVSAYSWNDPGVKTVEQAVEHFRPDYELLYGEELKTYRYYFLMPNGSNGDLGDDPSLESNGKFAPSWYNEFTETAGIYWWDTRISDPSAWIGYIAMKGDAEDVYYADVPTFVTGIVWNNGVDGGTDSTQPQFYKAAESADIGSEYYDPGESENYPDGTENFDNMIYVIDPDLVETSEYSSKQSCTGEWYYYYGDGCYGFVKGGERDIVKNCLRGDHDHTKIQKPTQAPTVKPTVKPTEAPTVKPTVAPTQPPTSSKPSYSKRCLHFDASTTGWKNFDTVYCHIWEYGGDAFYAYGSKKEKCNDNGDGTWTYDLDAKGLILQDGVLYSLLFANENGMQTHYLLFDITVLSDTAYCDGIKYENPVDSSKAAQAAYWRKQDKTKFGLELCITSIGNIIGTCIPRTTTAQALLIDFLKYNLNNARIYSGKTDQQLIDNIADRLELTDAQVLAAIKTAKVSVGWSSSDSDPGVNKPSYEYSNTLTFDVESAGWKNFNKIYCHIWEYGGDPFYAWQAKAEQCVNNGDGTWTYDLDAKGLKLQDGVLYSLVFANENGMQTHYLLFDTSVLGDTAYCDGTRYENPVDSSKAVQTAYWRKQDKSKFGPELCITSIGNIVGTCIPRTTSTYAMFVDFLENYLLNARAYSGKTDQQLLDDTAMALGLYKKDVEKAINNTGVKVSWKASKSTLREDAGTAGDSSEKPTSPGGNIPNILMGDVDGDNDVSIIDATTIQRLLARLLDRPINLDCADVDGDGDVSIIDATKIQRFLAKLIPSL